MLRDHTFLSNFCFPYLSRIYIYMQLLQQATITYNNCINRAICFIWNEILYYLACYFSIYAIQLKKRGERRGGEGESYVKAIKFDIKWYKYRVNRTNPTTWRIYLFCVYPTFHNYRFSIDLSTLFRSLFGEFLTANLKNDFKWINVQNFYIMLRVKKDWLFSLYRRFLNE